MTPLVSMRRALDDPNLLGKALVGPSWQSWRILLIASMGEALDERERRVFTELTGRELEPLTCVRELWGIIGRRGGKSRAIAVLAVYLAALVDHRAAITPGEVGVALCLAKTIDQAGVVFGYVRGILNKAPLLKQLVQRAGADSIELSNMGVALRIEVRPSSSRTLRGLTCVCAICDELAFWPVDDTSVNPDVEVIRSIKPSLLSTRGQLICISSPYAKRGTLWDAFKRHYGPRGDPLVLVARAPSLVMNSTLPRDEIERIYADDPLYAAGEYGAEFRTDVDAYVSPEIIEACVAQGIYELPPVTGIAYLAFVDPSGGSADSMTLAIAHVRGDELVLDLLREVMPPFNPESVVAEWAPLLRAYGVTAVHGDHYAGEWARVPFRRHGIDYLLAEQRKSDIYRDALPLFNAGRAQVLDNRRLFQQFITLERRTARGGRDSIDHPPGGHDDLANAVCGAFVLLEVERRPALIEVRSLTAAFDAVPDKGLCRIVTATCWELNGECAVVFLGSADWHPDQFLLDFDASFHAGNFLKTVAARARQLAEQAAAPAMALIVPSGLLWAAEPHAYAVPLPDWFDPEEALQFAAAQFHAGRIKFSALALDKMRTQPLGAALSFRLADKVESALQGALLAAVSACCDERLTSIKRAA
jgi:hypothetical protein